MKTYHCIIQFDGKSVEWTHHCSGPIIALNEFHRRAQRQREVGFDRKKVMRRKLRHDEYEIVRLWRDGVEYDDLPKTANPNLNAPKPAKVETPEFVGMPAQGEGGLST